MFIDIVIPQVKFRKLSKFAKSPNFSNIPLSSIDLFSAYDYNIDSWTNELVQTDIAIQIPEGYYGRFAPLRDLLNQKIITDVGGIESEKRTGVGIYFFNHSKEDFQIQKGQRIGKVICEKQHWKGYYAVKFELIETEVLDEPELPERSPPEAVDVHPRYNYYLREIANQYLS